MYVYMSECVYVFYVFICLQSDESERQGDNSLEGNLIALKNVVIFLHDPIIFYLVNRF